MQPLCMQQGGQEWMSLARLGQAGPRMQQHGARVTGAPASLGRPRHWGAPRHWGVASGGGGAKGVAVQYMGGARMMGSKRWHELVA
jgi:hypothetical protein